MYLIIIYNISLTPKCENKFGLEFNWFWTTIFFLTFILWIQNSWEFSVPYTISFGFSFLAIQIFPLHLITKITIYIYLGRKQLMSITWADKIIWNNTRWEIKTSIWLNSVPNFYHACIKSLPNSECLKNARNKFF